MSLKTCKRCSGDKSVDSFALDANRSDGRFSWCRTCVSEYQRGRRGKWESRSSGAQRDSYERNKEKQNTKRRLAYVKKAKRAGADRSTCTKCGSGKTGAHAWCRSCLAADQRERRAHEKWADGWDRFARQIRRAAEAAAKETGLKKCRKCSEWSDRVDGFYWSTDSKTRKRHPSSCKRCTRKSVARYVSSIPTDVLNARRRDWYRRNKDLHRATQQRRRARRMGCESSLTVDQWQKILELHGFRCAYCGGKQSDLNRKLEVDHVVPLVRGGKHTVDNVVPACRRCNAKKNTKILVPGTPLVGNPFL